MKISLTSFLDYLAATGVSKIPRVRAVKRQYCGAYNPAQDYYRPLREAVMSLHRDRSDLTEVRRVVDTGPSSRRSNYEACLTGYQGWLGRKEIQVLEPGGGDWQHNGITVRVNPELHLVVNGWPYLLKLYWKAKPVSKRQLDSTLHLMQETCGGSDARLNRGARCAQVQASRVHG